MGPVRGRTAVILAGLAFVAAVVVLLVPRSPAADPPPETPPRARSPSEPAAPVEETPNPGAPRAGLLAEARSGELGERASIRVRVDAEDGADLEVLVALSDDDLHGSHVSTARVRTGETATLDGPRGTCSVSARAVEDSLARRDLRYEEAREQVGRGARREARLVLPLGSQRLKVRVEDESGQRVPGARVFLDYMGLLRNSTATHLLDPRELEAAALGAKPMLDEWTRTTGPEGEADFGRVRGRTIDPERHAVVLSVPSSRGTGDVACEWEIASSSTLRVYRGTGTFHARLPGKAPPRWFRLQQRADSGAWRVGDVESAKVDASGDESRRVIAGRRVSAGTHRLVVLTDTGRMLESEFAVAAGADTEVTSFHDLGATWTPGRVTGPAVGAVHGLSMRVAQTDEEGSRFSEALIPLPVDDEGRFDFPVLPGVRRVSVLAGRNRLDWDWDDYWPTVMDSDEISTPFPDLILVRSARSGTLVVRGIDAAGRPSGILAIQVRSMGGAGGWAQPDLVGQEEPDPSADWTASAPFPGTWTVRVWTAGAAEDGPPSAEVEATVESGKETEVVVRLP